MSALSSLCSIFDRRETIIDIVGLDGSGKRTIMEKLEFGEIIKTEVTLGFQVETVQKRNVIVNSWDVGEVTKTRPLWKYYLENSKALIFVVDATDHDFMRIAADELKKLLDHELLTDACFLVLANKQDLPNAMSLEEMTTKLGLKEETDHPWHIQPTCGLSGDGLNEGFEWLINAIKYKCRRNENQSICAIF